jgi:hypothetical protein
MESVNWLEALNSGQFAVLKILPIADSVPKRGRPVGSKNKPEHQTSVYPENKENPDKMTKEQWKAAYWKLRRQYRKECLNQICGAKR